MQDEEQLGLIAQGQQRWRERWYGSDPMKGSAIVTESRDEVAIIGGDEETHKQVRKIVMAHNAALDESIRHQAERETLARMEPVAWKPIRTAPRNETMIVLGGEGQQTWVGFFSGWNNYWTTGEVDRSRDHVMHTPQPTHWMPLPPAPEAGQ